MANVGRAFEGQAIRIHDGVDLPEFEMSADRVLSVVAKPYADKGAWALAAVAFFWHRAQEEGTSEEEFRGCFAPTQTLALYADLEALPAYRPARTVTPEEARKLLTRGIADPIGG
jgi:hypothetical protein